LLDLDTYLVMASCTALALAEDIMPEQQERDSLDWTLTPKCSMSTDGHSVCFIATPNLAQESRQHALHLVRELEIQPTSFDKKKGKTKGEIRVREEDLRKWGDNLAMLSQCALPNVEAMTEMRIFGKKASNVSSRKRHSGEFMPFQSCVHVGNDFNREELMQKGIRVIRPSASDPSLSCHSRLRPPVADSLQSYIKPLAQQTRSRYLFGSKSKRAIGK
jgi:hypothetical protein